MISYLFGKIHTINEKYATVITNSGVGYKVFLPLNILLSKNKNENIEIFIQTIVKDDSIDLYGFIEEKELFLFEKLIKVSGVGPKSAMLMLSNNSVENISKAIENEDIEKLSKTPGIGKKTCERIIIELKGKLNQFINNSMISENKEEDDAILALVSLGYNEKNINLLLNEIKKENKDFDKLNVNEIIKLYLSKSN